MTTKAIAFFKAGAWIIMLAGFGHGAAALYDMFGSGAFSPSSAPALAALQGTSLNLVDWMGGRNTAVFESAWGAYVSFAIGIGLLMGFLGLLFVIISHYPEVLADGNFRLPLVAVIVSALITLFTDLFCFWFPTVIVAVVFACFVTALFQMRKGVAYAA
jgi:hypothetical protein